MTPILTIPYRGEFRLAAKLYELGRLILGQAAGGERVDFVLARRRDHVPARDFHTDDADEEVAFARHA